MLASAPRGTDHDSPTISRAPPAGTRPSYASGYGTCLGASSAYEMRIHADCVGLKKYGGLRYLSRES